MVSLSEPEGPLSLDVCGGAKHLVVALERVGQDSCGSAACRVRRRDDAASGLPNAP